MLGALVVTIALLGGPLASGRPPAAAQEEREPQPPAPTHYVRMSDGVLIALNVRMPDTYVEGKRYPTVFEMSGYDGAGAGDRTVLGQIHEDYGVGTGNRTLERGSRFLTDMFNRHYVTIHASIRGTGCSGGEFDLFSWRSALDGREIIDWIARQPWSDGDVGIYGHSYGGITGFMVAATRPPQLRAVSVSGLIDDLYRGISYPGGVFNSGFPVLWTLGIRPAYDVLGAQLQPMFVKQDPVCARNIATHRRTIVNDPVLQGTLGDTYNDWWRSRSPITYAGRIRAPIHITGAWQDEQTGPRFPHLFEGVSGVPKRMIMTNGDHGTQHDAPEIWRDRRAWMDHWLRGSDGGYGDLAEDRTSVVTLFDMHRDDGVLRSGGVKRSRTFPLEDTRWRKLFLRSGGRLTRKTPGPHEGADRYVSGSRRQSWNYQAGPSFGPPFTTADGPDELTYVSPALKRNTAVAGPTTASLFMNSSAPETEVFVQLIDVAPDGSRTYLQRGLLRASHRGVDPERSDWASYRGRRVMYRPYHPHTNPTPIVPGETYRFLVEVWPVGHVFREGHRIMVKIHAPPTVDSYYAYAPRYPPGVNTVLHDAGHRSRLLLPFVPLGGVDLGPPVPCGELTAVRCVPG